MTADGDVQRDTKPEQNWVRGVVLLLFAGTLFRIALIVTTHGTDDVNIFASFSDEVARVGPYGVYDVPTPIVYNHPPMVGWLLAALHWGESRGLPFPIGLRAISVAADLGSASLAYLIVTKYFGPKQGLIASALIALNPVSVFVSGFHGNVDPAAFFVALLAVFLATERDRPALSGLALGIACSIKLVPIVIFPVLLLWVARRRQVARFLSGMLIISGAIWGPALPKLPAVWNKVVAYTAGQGRLLAWTAALLSAGIGAFLAARWAETYRAAGAAILVLLFLSPAYAPQYLVWPVAFGAVMRTNLSAALYATVGGAFLFETYTRWSGGFPWDAAYGERGLDTAGSVLLFATWGAVALWLIAIARREYRRVSKLKSGAPTGTQTQSS